MNVASEIKQLLPYKVPFLFVDELTSVDEHGAKGSFRFEKGLAFYTGHFPGNPITPGVILIECMAQIGLVSLGIFLSGAYKTKEDIPFAFTSSEVEFYKAVLPGEKVFVESEKIYYRLGKLKCKVSMNNEQGERVCKGILSGMLIKNK
ncbi:MAG: 3-hydroxyacyl-ACP dehydratase FabZ family protein [Bacteroidota bacterium]